MPEIDLYARKSKILAQGDRLREVSTDEQLRQGRAWAARNGYTVRREWVELGSAYAERERPEFNGAVNAVLAGEVPALWCYMLDRFTRSGAEDVLRVIGKARVVFDYDDLDSSVERDRERIIMEAERARAYSHRLSVRVRDVKAGQRERGEWLGGSVPWGLAVDPRTRKVRPDDTPAGGTCFLSRADMARDWFRWLRAGVSARQIARDMNDMDIPAARGKHWHAAAILRMTASPAYAGLQVTSGQGKLPEIYRNERGETVSIGEGLVTLDEWRAARDAVSSVAHHGNRPGGKAKYLLTDLLRCAGCGRAMPSNGRSYVCGSLIQGRKDCPAPAKVSTHVIEAYVSHVWRHAVMSLEPTDDLAAVVAERWAVFQAPEQTAEHTAAQEALKAAETVRGRLRKAYRLGAYEGDDDSFTADIRAANDDVRAAQAELNKHAAPTPDPSFIDDPDLVDEAWNTADLPLRRDLLRLAVDRIDVRKADYPGQRFDGAARVNIMWAADAND